MPICNNSYMNCLKMTAIASTATLALKDNVGLLVNDCSGCEASTVRYDIASLGVGSALTPAGLPI